jgi:L-lysine 2,3-aminomutase
MLGPNELRSVAEALGDVSTTKVGVRGLVEAIRRDLNPHPSGQKEENVPRLNGQKVPGIQHKYRETVLFFPTEVSNSGRHISV